MLRLGSDVLGLAPCSPCWPLPPCDPTWACWGWRALATWLALVACLRTKSCGYNTSCCCDKGIAVARGGGGVQAGHKALHTCTSWYACAAMFGSSEEGGGVGTKPW